MKCTAPGRNIKVFGKAILCLAKIGEDIYFEGEASGLAVRTVNLSRSAYGSFSFQTSFFSKFSLQSQNSIELRCKVTSRSCLSIFKNLVTLEKSVENFSIELKFREGEFVFTLLHKTGIKKQYNLTFQECEGLSAIFNKNSSVIHIVSNQKFLSDCVVHFPTSVSEITLSVKHDHAMLTNYMEEQDQYAKALQTQMRLASSEFLCYDVSVNREVTFCLKEWRAVLALQDALGQQLHLYFDDPGRPIIMCIEGDGLYECDFVLATLTDQNSSQCSQSTNVSKVASVVEEKRSHSTSKTNIKSQTSTSRVSSKTATHQNGTTKTPFNPPNTTRKPSNPRFIDLDDSMDEPNPFSKPTFPSSAGQFIKPIQELANTSQVTRNISPPSEQTPLPEQQLVASLILSPELRSLSPLPPSPEQSERLPACLFSPQDNRAGNRTDILAPPPDSTSPPCKRFKRLSSDEDDEESVINPTNNILYCDDSD